jgi:hypothetical protein
LPERWQAVANTAVTAYLAAQADSVRLTRAAAFEVFKMPTLIRFLTIVAVIGGLIYGGIFALATFFDPEPREITVTVPPDKFQKR